MDLRSYCRLLTRRWRILVSVFLLIGAVLAAVGLLLPKTYIATARMVFAPKLSTYTSMEIRQTAQSYVADRMKTYAQVVTTDQVLQPVIDSLKLGVTVPDLVKNMDVAVPLNTSVVTVSVKAPTAEAAAATANRITNEMPSAVADLEGSSTVSESPIQVSVLQPADIPLRASWPNIPLNLLVAVGLAIVAAIFAAVIVDNFDSRVRRRRDVTALSVPYLGGLPAVRDASTLDLLQFTKLRRELRSVIHRVAIDVLYAVDGIPRSVVITSPQAGAGKTVVAADLAGALAEAGNRVVFIDADVRGGRLAPQIGIPQTHGVTDLASGRVKFDESILQRHWGGFTVVPCGASATDISEMLAGDEFGEFMQQLAGYFDVVIVDAPPITNLSEASLLTRHISDVVVVAQAGTTRRADLLRVIGSLRHAGAKVLGVVLSRARDEQPAPPDAKVPDHDDEPSHQ